MAEVCVLIGKKSMRGGWLTDYGIPVWVTAIIHRSSLEGTIGENVETVTERTAELSGDGMNWEQDGLQEFDHDLGIGKEGSGVGLRRIQK